MPYKDPKKQQAWKNEWARKYRKEHPDKYAGYKSSYRKRLKAMVAAWLEEYRKTIKCARCDESHPGCMHFHHVNPEEKRFDISRGIHNCFSLEIILKEVAKCIVLCANCHAKHHWEERQASINKRKQA